jgi:hypothetical protein
MTTRGRAIVITSETAFRIAPNPQASLIETLPAETIVTLTSQYNGLWVSVTTAESVLPGWVLGTDLRRLGTDPATTVISSTSNLTQTPTLLPGTAPPTAASAPPPAQVAAISVRPISPLLPDSLPVPAPRVSLTVSVTVVVAQVLTAASAVPMSRTAMPQQRQPNSGLRVQIIDVFGNLLAEAITNAGGQVALTHAVERSQTITIRLPAAGLEVPVEPGQPTIMLAIPPGDLP